MDRRLGDTGFTLIELMIVVAVLAVLSTSVVLSVSRSKDTIRSDVQRFQAVHDQLVTEASMSKRLMALSINESGYQRLLWQQGAWETIGTQSDWQNSVSVLVPFQRDQPIEVSPAGQNTPFRIRFGGDTQTRICSSDGWGPMSCNG